MHFSSSISSTCSNASCLPMLLHFCTVTAFVRRNSFVVFISQLHTTINNIKDEWIITVFATVTTYSLSSPLSLYILVLWCRSCWNKKYNLWITQGCRFFWPSCCFLIFLKYVFLGQLLMLNPKMISTCSHHVFLFFFFRVSYLLFGLKWYRTA